METVIEAASPGASGVDRPPPPRRVPDRVREWVVWFGPGRLAVGGAVVGILVLAGFWLLRAPAPPVEASLPLASTPATPSSIPIEGSSTTAGEPATILVHVAGAVSVPGVHALASGARVVDAIVAAGGAADGADLDPLNLAAPLADGDRVYVPRPGELAAPPAGVTPGTASPAGAAGPLGLNDATVDELVTLPGIGPAIAAAIVAHREDNGPFASVDDLADVPGIGPAKLEALRGLVTP